MNEPGGNSSAVAQRIGNQGEVAAYLNWLKMSTM
jgi:hypothetical protein